MPSITGKVLHIRTLNPKCPFDLADMELFLPIATVSEANIAEHWTRKAHRHKMQKNVVHWHLKTLGAPPDSRIPLVITLTRISSRTLDTGDNLPCSMKYIRDAIAEWLRPGLAVGRADDDKNLTWVYDQIKCRKNRGVKIKIEEKKE